jgi:histone acetyltransferase (RNA polymerase elongator complex component)
LRISKIKKTPFIIPIFITHQGCPHRCIFCNQESITGNSESFDISATVEYVRKTVVESLLRPRDLGRDVQVAFYGGSFTGLPIEQQDSLLGAVKSFINCGQVHSIRLSTRPDYIAQDSAEFLYDRGVRVVELGVQSLESEVLQISQRGHNVSQVEEAFSILKQSELLIGGQLMVGLPGETVAGAVRGAALLASFKPDFVRIYPALVVRGSGLENLYRRGKYKPLSLNKAISLTARLKSVFDSQTIGVIRMGLQPTSDLDANIVAGPHHPAFGELVKSRLMYKKIRDALHGLRGEGERKLLIAAADQSIFRGQKNCSANKLRKQGLLDHVSIVFDEQQPRGTFACTPMALPAGRSV